MELNIDTLSFPIAYPDNTNAGIMHHCHGFSENNDKTSIFLERDFLGLVFNLNNNIRYTTGSTQLTLLKRQYCLAFIPTGNAELAIETGKYSAFCIAFTPYFLGRIKDHFPVLADFVNKVEAHRQVLTGDPQRIAPKILHEIHLVLNEKSQAEKNIFLLGAKYVIISMDCLRHLGSFGALDEDSISKIREAHDYIKKNFRFACSVSQIADMVKMNARQLQRGFKIVYGKTVYKFLTSERMNRSTALLRDTNMSLKEIATSVGYKNAKTFYHIFKRNFGYPPGKLQKKAAE